MQYRSKKIGILGFGLEGGDVLGFLSEEDARITILDKKPREELDLDSVGGGVEFRLGEDYLKDGLTDFDIIIRSPGVYRKLPEILEAEKKGVKITSATQIFFENCAAKIIGITGTKGKGTTATLVYEILKKAGKKVFLVGNIGKPFLELLDTLDSSSIVVMELSSFQLIDLNKSPHIGVVLNITQDHLDWHEDLNEYVTAKKNIISHQKETDFAVINNDYETSKSFENLGGGKKFYFSSRDTVEGAYIKDGDIFLSTGSYTETIGPVSNLRLRGSHNWENIAAAILAASLAGADINSITHVVFSFKGLEHRLELVGEYEGVKFYNDSFSTGPQPTIAAVNSFTEPVTLILGGRTKGLDYTEMAKQIKSKKNIQKILLIGEIGPDLGQLLVRSGFDRQLIDLGGASMNQIVKRAFSETPKGGVVLLSPGATSFDMFENYKERGKEFKLAVEGLKK